MSEEAIVVLCILGMLLLAVCFIAYICEKSEIKQKEILKEVVQEVIKYEQQKESSLDEK